MHAAGLGLITSLQSHEVILSGETTPTIYLRSIHPLYCLCCLVHPGQQLCSYVNVFCRWNTVRLAITYVKLEINTGMNKYRYLNENIIVLKAGQQLFSYIDGFCRWNTVRCNLAITYVTLEINTGI